ncbi:PilZ domain-containing protein [Pseudomonas sp. NY15181]|uniref:PilZ domain-containing protein n=1 Tax=Pseudomonas sp. NY15181 TaxID=3400349 RepID=UPI003A875895
MRHSRHIERHQLPYYLKVFNSITDKPMGYLGNVSLDGMLLISQLPMLVGGRFDMRLKIPGHDGKLQLIEFSATCQWCREDVNPGNFDSGFSLVAPPMEYVELVDALRRYFSFRRQVESV